MHINQIDLINAILQEIERQHPGVKALPRQMNQVISSANHIVDAFGQEEVEAPRSCGLDAWLASDQKGQSSYYMASVLSGKFIAPNNHPHDPSDFGRCLGLFDAVPEFRKRIGEMAGKSKEWKNLVEHWDELETLYEEEAPSGTAPKLYEKMKNLLHG